MSKYKVGAWIELTEDGARIPKLREQGIEAGFVGVITKDSDPNRYDLWAEFRTTKGSVEIPLTESEFNLLDSTPLGLYKTPDAEPTVGVIACQVDDGFYEEDEPVESVVEAFDKGEKFVTTPPGVSIPVDLDKDQLYDLMLEAHAKNITLSHLLEKAVLQKIADEYQKHFRKLALVVTGDENATFEKLEQEIYRLIGVDTMLRTDEGRELVAEILSESLFDALLEYHNRADD